MVDEAKNLMNKNKALTQVEAVGMAVKKFLDSHDLAKEAKYISEVNSVLFKEKRVYRGTTMSGYYDAIRGARAAEHRLSPSGRKLRR